MDGRANPLMDRKVVGVSGYLSIYLSVYLQAWKRSYSGRIPAFLILTIKNEAILRNCPLCRACHATCIFAPSMVCFFHILTSKIASRHNGLRFFLTAQLPEAEVFLAFWLRNLLRATTACNFSSLIWPDGSAPAALPSLLFDTPGPQIIEKTWWLATFLPFSDSFFSLTFFLLLFSCLTLPTSAFHLSILSEVWLLNFLRKYN